MTEDTYFIKKEDLTTNFDGSIKFNSINSEILRIQNNGEIIWNSPYGKIEVKTKETFVIALMDVITNLTNNKYDYSLLDPKIYSEYQKFLNSGDN